MAPTTTALPLGYVPYDAFIGRLGKRPPSVDALLAHMDYPGVPGSVRNLNTDEKLAKALSQAAHLKNELPEYKALSPEDILVWECYETFTTGRYRIPAEHFELLFGPDEEHEITKPFARALYRLGYSIFLEVPIGKSRADIVAYKTEGECRILALELKTKVVQLKKCFAQLMDYQTGVDEVYLGTTPGAIIKYLTADVDEVDPRMLEQELRKCGAGLMVFDFATGECKTVMKPPGLGRPRKDTRDWLLQRCEEILKQEVPMFGWTEDQKEA